MSKSSNSLVVRKKSSRNKITFSDYDKYENAVHIQEDNLENSIQNISDIEEELRKLKLLEEEMLLEEKIAKKREAEEKRRAEQERKEALARKKIEEQERKEAIEKAKLEVIEKEKIRAEREALDKQRIEIELLIAEQKRIQENNLKEQQEALKKAQEREAQEKVKQAIEEAKKETEEKIRREAAEKAKKELLNQKHTIVSADEFENNYDYDERRESWHKLAGHNEKQLVCSCCKDDDNWETILLNDGRHICYYCWIKKPETLKSNKSNNHSMVVKKPTVIKTASKDVDYEDLYAIELDTLRTAFQVLPKPVQKEYEKNIYRMIDRLIELKFIEKRH